VSKPVVHLYTVCWDEADMLGFFFRHYDPWVDRYVIYDDGSTDGSLDILRSHPKVELRRFERVDPDSFVLSHKAMQDEAWKESRGRADWVVVTAIDEHLHVRGRSMAEYLAAPDTRAATILPALGFDMNHPVMPADHGVLVERVVRGRPRIAFNKLSIFRPDAVRETGFGPGRHAAEPVGDLRLPLRDTVMLWHYKHLGFERNAAREAEQALRLGATDVARDYGQHYRWSKARLRAFWDEMEQEAVDLSAPDLEPDRICVGPLWWTARADIVRRGPQDRVVAAPAAAPLVSVLVKSYNHAAFVRQTIESVLSQSLQDFEIVVTDDGSTDGTCEILRGFDDPRLHLTASPRNAGISAAMNATVGRARGRYLAILNSDDWALPGRLERQVAFLEANPQVSLLFGMPRPVDEAGQPTQAFNDFRAPLRWPDFSRRTWLRAFFFEGNCLCAPSAMIRREAYAVAGPYDPRLTNLQDLDMWIRMLAEGHAIHVLPDELTAFRIHPGGGNTSARPEARLRTPFETIQILHRYASFDADLFEEVFGGSEAGAFDPADPVPLRVAALAAGIPSVAHRSLALALLFAHARTSDDYQRLRDLSGTLDALNVRALDEREGRIAGLNGLLADRDAGIAGLNGSLADRDARIAGLDGLLAERDAGIASLDGSLAARDARIADLVALLADREGARAATEAALSQTRAERTALDARLSDAEVLLAGHRTDLLHAREDKRALEKRLREATASCEALAADRMRDEAATRDLEARLAATLASRERMRRSLSWRLTTPLRWIGRRR
jgi:glycosyltransferase involved in cell wall biosynthesis